MELLSRILLLVLVLSVTSASRLHSDVDVQQAPHDARPTTLNTHRQVKMTTQELTLNLSSIRFPKPARQGDNLNLSAIEVSSTSGRCPTGYVRSGNSGVCRIVDLMLMQNLDAQNLIVGRLNLDELRNKQQEFRQNNVRFVAIRCTEERPFLSRTGCVSCLEPYPYFNLESLRCSQCPKGSSYISEERSCQVGSKEYLTNLQDRNVLVLPDKSIQKYKTEYQTLTQQNPGLLTCPADRPYSAGGECNSCPREKPLFFLPARLCTKCQNGSAFSPETNLCIASAEEQTTSTSTQTTIKKQKTSTVTKYDTSVNREKWTVEKGLGNIFGWQRKTLRREARAEDEPGSSVTPTDEQTTVQPRITKTTSTRTRVAAPTDEPPTDEPATASTKDGSVSAAVSKRVSVKQESSAKETEESK